MARITLNMKVDRLLMTEMGSFAAIAGAEHMQARTTEKMHHARNFLFLRICFMVFIRYLHRCRSRWGRVPVLPPESRPG